MDEKINKLAKLIAQYRKDEIEFTIDDTHICRWVEQFDAKARDIILQETINIFKSGIFIKRII